MVLSRNGLLVAFRQEDRSLKPAFIRRLEGPDSACSGDMLLPALVARAGVTLTAVITSLGVKLRGGRVTAEGDLDVRGTLGIEKDVSVGFKQIRLRIVLDADASPDERARLMELTE
jgi:hypothetical protein